MSQADKILSRLRRQAGAVFRRGDFNQHDKELVQKWIEKFARMCQEDSSDESD